MDQDLARMLRRTARGSRRPGLRVKEWRGTGLCPEAQADGVPCPDPATSCDTCGRGMRSGWCGCRTDRGRTERRSDAT